MGESQVIRMKTFSLLFLLYPPSSFLRPRRTPRTSIRSTPTPASFRRDDPYVDLAVATSTFFDTTDQTGGYTTYHIIVYWGNASGYYTDEDTTQLVHTHRLWSMPFGADVVHRPSSRTDALIVWGYRFLRGGFADRPGVHVFESEDGGRWGRDGRPRAGAGGTRPMHVAHSSSITTAIIDSASPSSPIISSTRRPLPFCTVRPTDSSTPPPPSSSPFSSPTDGTCSSPMSPVTTCPTC